MNSMESVFFWIAALPCGAAFFSGVMAVIFRRQKPMALAHALLLLEASLSGGAGSDLEDVDAVVTEHLQRALELAPDLPEAFGVQGYHYLQRYRDEEARVALDRAISLNPNYALAYDWRADIAFGEE